MLQTLSSVLVLLAQLNAPGNEPSPMPEPEVEGSQVCVQTHHTIMETNRICYYLCEGQEATVTIPLTEECPEEIRR